MNKSAIVIIAHFSFWIFNVFVNILFTNLSIGVQIMSTLIFGIPFYINYALLVPHILKRISFRRSVLWIISYATIHFITCYPLYQFFPDVFQSPGIVSNAIGLGAVLHISFYYLAFSTGSRLVFEWVKHKKITHRLYMQKKSKEIESLKLGMSFPFVKGVLQQLEKEGDQPQNIVRSVSALAKVLRFKLYRKEDDSIMLSDEVKIIEQYLSLLSIYDDSDWSIEIEENLWVEKGIAFLRVEEFILFTNFRSGVLVISVKNKNIQISLKKNNK